ncbi:MAG: AAA family ATPase [Thermoplasmata archaeon]
MSDEPAPVAPEVAAAEAGTSAGTAEPAEALRQLSASIGREIVGHTDVIRALTVALVSEGHILLEGVPGLAKTQLVRAFADTLRLTFRRIQFTPDMLPSDILGTTILRPKDQSFEFRPGPIFANVVLADEINRAPPKVQSALLEAMQERQVTLDGVSHPLPSPFLVIATQNPLEHEGTYPLPEAELDRFLFRWLMGYPSVENEVGILRSRVRREATDRAVAVLSPADVERLRTLHRAVFVHEDIYRYLATLVRQTRVDRRLLLGASPRASVQYLQAAKAVALLDGRSYVLPDDVRELAFPVFNHRVIVRPEVLSRAAGTGASGSSVTPLGQILTEVLDAVDVPR